MPLRGGVPVPEGVKPFGALTPMAVDYSKLAERLEELSRGYLKEWADRG